jgi:hypothetical protein
MTLDTLYIWLHTSSLLVIVGVIFEIEEIVTEIRETGFKKLKHVWVKIGFLTLVVGLCGELLFQTKIESADAELKRKSDIEIADAKTDAAKANKRARELSVEAGRLRLALEAAKGETARLSQGVSSRHVLSAQKTLIRSAVEGAGFSLQVVSWSAGEPEVLAYRDELANAFNVNGATVSVGTNTVSPPQVGLLVFDSPDRADSVISRAPELAGIDFEYRKVETPRPIIRVGVKKPTL